MTRTARATSGPARSRSARIPDRPDQAMGYWQVPAEVLEDAEELAVWAREAMMRRARRANEAARAPPRAAAPPPWSAPVTLEQLRRDWEPRFVRFIADQPGGDPGHGLVHLRRVVATAIAPDRGGGRAHRHRAAGGLAARLRARRQGFAGSCARIAPRGGARRLVPAAGRLSARMRCRRSGTRSRRTVIPRVLRRGRSRPGRAGRGPARCARRHRRRALHCSRCGAGPAAVRTG